MVVWICNHSRSGMDHLASWSVIQVVVGRFLVKFYLQRRIQCSDWFRALLDLLHKSQDICGQKPF